MHHSMHSCAPLLLRHELLRGHWRKSLLAEGDGAQGQQGPPDGAQRPTLCACRLPRWAAAVCGVSFGATARQEVCARRTCSGLGVVSRITGAAVGAWAAVRLHSTDRGKAGLPVRQPCVSSEHTMA